MRIPKNKTQEILEGAERFLLVADAMDGDITLHKEGKTLLSLSLSEEGHLTVKAYYTEGEVLTLEAEGARGHEVILTQGRARLALYVEGVLLDEDFFFGTLDFSGCLIETQTYMHFEAGFEYHSAIESTPIADVIENPNGFRPIGKDMGILSCRPAVLGERLHLFYLDCRRQGRCKQGKGADRVSALYTEGGLFGTAPLAVGIDDKREYKVLDATCYQKDGRAYLYYLMEREEGRVCRVSVSEDGFSFQKTELDVVIPAFFPEKATSLQMCEQEGDVYLVFAQEGRLYAARSIDLLHFDLPALLETEGEISTFSLFTHEKTTYLLSADEEGALLYQAKGAFPHCRFSSPTPQALPLRQAKACVYRGALWITGEKDGALFARVGKVQDNTVTV